MLHSVPQDNKELTLIYEPEWPMRPYNDKAEKSLSGPLREWRRTRIFVGLNHAITLQEQDKWFHNHFYFQMEHFVPELSLQSHEVSRYVNLNLMDWNQWPCSTNNFSESSLWLFTFESCLIMPSCPIKLFRKYFAINLYNTHKHSLSYTELFSISTYWKLILNKVLSAQ